MLTIGVSEVDITPAPGLKMMGMFRPPAGNGVHFPLMARTFVLDDGQERAAVVCLDLLWLTPATMNEYRQHITAGTELRPEHVMLVCNHTHRAPHTSCFMDEDTDFGYVDWLRGRLVAGMREALAARQPARLRAGHVQVPGWTFNRRTVYRTSLGEQVGTQGPMWLDSFLRLEGPADHELRVMLAEDAQGRTIGGLVNFACHSTVMGAQSAYSADWSGVLTAELAARHGGVFGFLQGASGNLWAVNRGPERRNEPRLLEMGPEHASRMGKALADKADEALADGGPLVEGPVRVARHVLEIAQRCPTREQVGLAKWYLEQAKPDVDEDAFTRRLYGHAYTFFGNSAMTTQWFCREVIGMWEWQRRVGRPEILEDVEVSAIAVGDAAIVGFPAEYFTEFGLRTKANSPFRETFIAQLANGWHGYVPTVEAFAHGGYEPRLGYSSRLVPEAGDRMCYAAIRLLAELEPRAH